MERDKSLEADCCVVHGVTARRDSPLLIDQPEDNLDNHFIFETVVSAVQRLKQHPTVLLVSAPAADAP